MVSKWDSVCLVANTSYPSPLTGEITAIVIAGLFVFALVIIVLCCILWVLKNKERLDFYLGKNGQLTFNPLKKLLSTSVGVHNIIYSAHNYCTTYQYVHDFT